MAYRTPAQAVAAYYSNTSISTIKLTSAPNCLYVNSTESVSAFLDRIAATYVTQVNHTINSDYTWQNTSDYYYKYSSGSLFFPTYIFKGFNVGSSKAFEFKLDSSNKACGSGFGHICTFDPSSKTALAIMFCAKKMFDSSGNLIPINQRVYNIYEFNANWKVAYLNAYMCFIDYNNNSIKAISDITGLFDSRRNVYIDGTSYDFWTQSSTVKCVALNNIDTNTSDTDSDKACPTIYNFLIVGSDDNAALNTSDTSSLKWTSNSYNTYLALSSGVYCLEQSSHPDPFTVSTRSITTLSYDEKIDKFLYSASLINSGGMTYANNCFIYSSGFIVENSDIKVKVLGYKDSHKLSSQVINTPEEPLQTMNVSISQSSFAYGTANQPNPQVSGQPSGATTVIEYKPVSSGSWSTTKPTAVGSYKVRATVSASGYTTATCETTFNITENTINVSVSQQDFAYGTPNQPNPQVSGNTGNGAVTFTYNPTPPVNPGTYTVTANIAAANGYAAATCSTTFIITKISNPGVGSLDLFMDSYYVGDTPSTPTYNSSSLNGATISFTYKNIDTNEVTTTPPTVAGRYMLIAQISETPLYNSHQAATQFRVIAPQAITVTIADIPDLTLNEAQEYPNDFKPAVSGLPNDYAGTYTVQYRSDGGSWQSSFIKSPIGDYQYRAEFTGDNRYDILITFENGTDDRGTYRIIEDITYFDVADGSSDFILRSSTYVGNAQAGSTELYLKYNTNTIEQLPIHKEYDNGAMITVQASVNELQNINVDTLIELHCPYCVDSYIINNDKIIIFTSSADSYATAYEKLQGTPYSFCMVDDNNIAAIKEAMPYNRCVRRVPAGSGNNIINDYSDSFIIDLDSEVITDRDMLFGAALRKDGTIEYIDGDERRLLLETPYHTIANYYYPNAKIYYETVKE